MKNEEGYRPVYFRNRIKRKRCKRCNIILNSYNIDKYCYLCQKKIWEEEVEKGIENEYKERIFRKIRKEIKDE